MQAEPIASPRKLRVLVVTRIFPNRLEPLTCAFNRQQIAALSRTCDVEVIAAIPYLPRARMLVGDRSRASRLASLPKHDVIDGVHVRNAKIPYVPRAGRALAPINVALYFAALIPELASLRGRFDIVLGTYLHPDAVAAALLARALGVPYAVKAHGTDVNTVSRWVTVRPMLRATLRSATVAFGVSAPMTARLVELGAPPERAFLLHNGVSKAVFYPRNREESRRRLSLPEHGRIVVFVGRLVLEKGLRELMAAFTLARRARAKRGALPMHLVFVGEGPLRDELMAFARAASGPSHQVLLRGPLPLEDVAEHIAASDVLALPSFAEGTPNVLLESFASGRPVVATEVGGVPDIVNPGENGLLVPPGNVEALALALDEAVDARWDEHAIVATAPPSWDASAGELERCLASAVARTAAA